MYSQALVSWSSKKQPSVALSSCEAEIMALSEASKEAKYLRRFFDEIGLGHVDPLSLGVDVSSDRIFASGFARAFFRRYSRLASFRFNRFSFPPFFVSTV